MHSLTCDAVLPPSFLLRCLPLAFHFSRADKCVSDCGPSHNTAPRLGGGAGRPGPPCEFPPLGFRITKAPIARAGSPHPPRPAALTPLPPPPLSCDADQPPPPASWALIQLAKAPTSCQGHLYKINGAAGALREGGAGKQGVCVLGGGEVGELGGGGRGMGRPGRDI